MHRQKKSGILPESIASWERELGINGVLFGRNRVVAYNSSLLVEIHRKPSDGLYEELNHLYWIVTSRGVLRRWGVHKETTDTYSAVYGRLEVALWDGRDESSTLGNTIVIELISERGEALRVPPGVWHTFRSKTETSVLLNSKSPSWKSYDTDKISHDFSESNPPFQWPES